MEGKETPFIFFFKEIREERTKNKMVRDLPKWSYDFSLEMGRYIK
jgi:hypothetical protein